MNTELTNQLLEESETFYVSCNILIKKNKAGVL